MIVKEDLDNLKDFIEETGKELSLSASYNSDIRLFFGHDVSVEFNSSLSNLELVRRLSKKILSLSDLFSEFSINDISLAIDEAVTNIIKHSYKNDSGKIVLRIKTDKAKVELEIKDFGKGGACFNPGMCPDLNKEEILKNNAKNGFGIYLIKKIMDKINYYVCPGTNNTLYMEKYSDKLLHIDGN
jgi:serine/threonine-protein kinase RsbW